MVANILHALSAVVLLASAWIAVSALRMKREIRNKEERLAWLQDEAVRAVMLLQSQDAGRILTGLQTLGALNVREARLQALQTIAALVHSNDPAVAACASDTLQQMLPAISAPPKGRPRVSTVSS